MSDGLQLRNLISMPKDGRWDDLAVPIDETRLKRHGYRLFPFYSFNSLPPKSGPKSQFGKDVLPWLAPRDSWQIFTAFFDDCQRDWQWITVGPDPEDFYRRFVDPGAIDVYGWVACLDHRFAVFSIEGDTWHFVFAHPDAPLPFSVSNWQQNYGGLETGGKLMLPASLYTDLQRFRELLPEDFLATRRSDIVFAE